MGSSECPAESIHRIGLSVFDRLLGGAHPDVVETEALHALRGLSGLGLLVSGRNRRLGRMTNTVDVSASSRGWAIVLNVLDGSENYARGSPWFGASIAYMDREANTSHSIVLDARTRQVLRFPEQSLSALPHDRSRRLVVGLGRLTELSASSRSLMESSSLRGGGSTTISVLQVVMGHVDCYITRTKMWNIFWSLPLCRAGLLTIEDISNGDTLEPTVERWLATPANSIDIIAYRTLERRSLVAPLIEDYRRSPP